MLTYASLRHHLDASHRPRAASARAQHRRRQGRGGCGRARRAHLRLRPVLRGGSDLGRRRAA
eukprot:8841156-Prorocentrum_lima.AAC.1